MYPRLAKDEELLKTRNILLLLNLTLLLLLCLTVTRTVLDQPDRVLPTAPPPPSVAAPEPARTAAPAPPPADYDAIVRRNLFGAAPVDSAPSPPATTHEPARTAPPPEPLDLRLQGTIAGPPDVARALIEDLSNGTIGLYRLGDPVAGGRLTDIDRDFVTLSIYGHRKTLRLQTDSHEPSPLADGRRPVSQPVVPTKPDPIVSPRNPAAAMQQLVRTAAMAPQVIDGKPQGLRITHLDDRKASAPLDLKNGDIIRSVNGQQLTSRQKAFQVFQKARTQQNLTVELLRDSDVRQLTFAIR